MKRNTALAALIGLSVATLFMYQNCSTSLPETKKQILPSTALDVAFDRTGIILLEPAQEGDAPQIEIPIVSLGTSLERNIELRIVPIVDGSVGSAITEMVSADLLNGAGNRALYVLDCSDGSLCTYDNSEILLQMSLSDAEYGLLDSLQQSISLSGDQTTTPPTLPSRIEAISEFLLTDANWASKNNFDVGAEIKFKFITSEPGYFALLTMNSSFEIEVLFPGSYQAFYLTTSTTTQLPPSGARYEFVVTPPRGSNLVRLVFIKSKPEIDILAKDLSSYVGMTGMDNLTKEIVQSASDGRWDFSDKSYLVNR